MGRPGTPESFKVLIKELRSLGLDMKVLTQEGAEVNSDEESTLEIKVGGLKGTTGGPKGRKMRYES